MLFAFVLIGRLYNAGRLEGQPVLITLHDIIGFKLPICVYETFWTRSLNTFVIKLRRIGKSAGEWLWKFPRHLCNKSRLDLRVEFRPRKKGFCIWRGSL